MVGDNDLSSDSDEQLIQLDGESRGADDDLLLIEEPHEGCPTNKRHLFWVRWICHRPKTMFAVTASFHLTVVVVSLVLFLTGYDIIHLVVKGLPVYDVDDIMYTRFLAWSRKDPKSPFVIKVSDMYPKRRKRSVDDEFTADHLEFTERYYHDINNLINNGILSAPAQIGDIFGKSIKRYPDSMLGGRMSPPNLPYAADGMSKTDSVRVSFAKLPAVREPNLYSHSARSRLKRSEKHACNYWLHEWFDFIYDTDADIDNILTPKYLKAIQRFETEMTKEFSETMYGRYEMCICQIPSTWSVLDVFDKDLIHIRKDEESTFFLAKTGSVDNDTRLAQSHITRSYFRVCTNASWQNGALPSWGHQVFLSRAHQLGAEILKPKGITLSYFSFNVYMDKIFKTIVNGDLYLFCGSVLFIFAFMWLQTGSFWITFFGISSILTSILAANLVYNCVIGFKYLGIFNLLSLFVVLGIGADDIFIFVDTWKWLDGKCDQQEERISMCFKKAGVAMFSTSLTTMVAFFVSAFSSLLTLRSFGTLSGLVVLINYISVMVFFPTVILAHESVFGKKGRTLRCSRLISVFSKSNNCMKKIHEAIVGFFGGIYFDVITHKYGRYAIIAAFVIFTGGMGLSVADLKEDDSATSQLLRTESPFEQGRIKASKEFKQNAYDLKMDVFLVWGFKPRDMSTCNKLRYDYEKPCPGKEAMDDHFQLESPKTQMALLELCQSLEHANASLVEKLKLKRDQATNKYTVVCIMEAFDTYLRGLSSKLMINITLPVTKGKLQPVLPLLKMAGILDVDIDKLTTPFQTLLWIFLEKSDFAQQLNKLAGFKELTDQEKNESIGTYKGEALFNRQLRYISILVPTSRSIMAIGIDEGIKMMNNWESYTDAKVSTLPEGLKGGFQVSQNWFLLNMKERLVMNAVIGVGVSLGLAFTLLLITTRNIILALISLITLSATVVCVIGIMPVMNWKLGPLVALNMCFVAGLAVDYIVHVIEGFQLSDYHTRHDRIQECLRHVGISVISGAITTLGSSFFMLFAKINFFMQFGWFIFCTIGTSLMFSLFFLPALLSVVGPSGDQGSVMALCKSRKKESDTRTDPSL
ncbi:uncharacterized protein LOC135488360 [Lineus longissimus]|uniref:uncharacterized protein LOC135488360 n=1 Tax=Lineus longissimus TaxID=88925 RepID=UPI00315CA6A8